MKKLIIGIGALLVLLLYFSYLEEKDFQAWAVKNHCKIVGQQDSSTSLGVGTGTGSDGTVTTVVVPIFNPSKTIYKCYNGFIRIR